MQNRNKKINRVCSELLFLIMLLFPGSFIFAQNNAVLTFTDAINLALNNNQGLAAESAGLEVKKKDIEIARSGFLPSLDFSASYFVAEGNKVNDWDRLGLSSDTQGTASGSLSQMIYNEQLISNHKIQKDLYTSREEQFRNSRNQLISAVGQAYIGVLVAEDILDVTKVDRDLTLHNLNEAAFREEIGSASRQEVLRWKTKLYNAEQSIAGQQASAGVSRITLNQVLNQPGEQIDTLEELSVEKYGYIFSKRILDRVLENKANAIVLRDYLVELGLGNSPVLGSLDAQISAQNRQLKSNKRWLIPNVSFLAGADSEFVTDKTVGGDDQTQSGADYWFVGAQLNWNVFKGGANISRLKQQKIQARELQFQRAEVMTAQEKAIRSNISLLIADYKKVGLANDQAEVANENYEMVYEAYILGEVSLLSLLDAQEQKLIASYSAVLAYYTFLVDVLVVEESIGYFPFLEPQEEVALIISELERRML